MANASPNMRRPNLTYIPPARIGGSCWVEGGRVGQMGGCFGSARLFGY